MRAFLASMLIGASAFAAPVPKEAKKTPLDQLQGKWIDRPTEFGGGDSRQHFIWKRAGK